MCTYGFQMGTTLSQAGYWGSDALRAIGRGYAAIGYGLLAIGYRRE